MPLAPEAAQVRQIQPPDASGPCKFLGAIEGSGGMFYSSRPEAERDMRAKIRSEAARRAANAYVLTALVVDRDLSLPFAQGDAYKCP